MTDHELVDDFVAITNAPRHVAEHLLEAHGGDMDAAVDFYLESGGVGHGQGASDAYPVGTAVADHFDPAGSLPLPASAVPRSSPVEFRLESVLQLLDEDEDDDGGIEILASSLGRRGARRSVQGAREEDVDLVGSDEGGGGRRNPAARRVRRNRPRGAAEADMDLVALGRRMAVAASPNTASGSGAWADNDDEDMAVDLPDDVDLEEQRMLLAAMTGARYEGRVPDFATDPRYRPRNLSPGAAQREQLRQEQDAAYYESLAADKRKLEETERAKREVAVATERAKREVERAEQAQHEAAEARERQMRSKQAALPPEPAADENAVMIVVRMPGGGRLSRRFRPSDQLESVFDFVDVAGQGAEVQPGTYNLVSQFPRRVFKEGDSQSLAEADLAHKQEAVFIEMKD